ncbi:MAG: hypothetical protein ACRDYD_10150 [Acidimicrobiales bacterium]
MRWQLGSGFVVLAALGTAALGTARAVAQGTDVPGGYTTVVTVQSVPATGGTVSARVDGAAVQVTVPAGAFGGTIQVVLTAPDLSGIGSAGQSGYSAVAGAGVLLESHGQEVSASGPQPVQVTLSDAQLDQGDRVVSLSPSGSHVLSGATAASGRVTVSLTSSADLAVVAPASAPIGGATTASTGKPFVAEGMAAVLLSLGGGSVLVARRRARLRRAHS